MDWIPNRKAIVLHCSKTRDPLSCHVQQYLTYALQFWLYDIGYQCYLFGVKLEQDSKSRIHVSHSEESANKD